MSASVLRFLRDVSSSVVLLRFSVNGLVNGVIAYAVIFYCMQLGLSPTISNMLGYAMGLVTLFLQSRHWVFRSAGKAKDEWPRFIVVFLLAYAANFVALQIFLGVPLNAYLAQILACGVYVGISFTLSSRFVFR
jgi:putative flippase GtrA